MKLFKFLLIIIVFTSCKTKFFSTSKYNNIPLNSKIDSVSYAMGIVASEHTNSIFSDLTKNYNTTINKPLYLQGFENRMDSTNFRITHEKSKKLLNDFKKSNIDKKQVNLAISSKSQLKTTMDSLSYALGIKNGDAMTRTKEYLKNNLDINLNMNTFKSGLFNGVDSLNIRINQADSEKLLENLYKKRKSLRDLKNKKAGEDFLLKNKTKKDVKTTPSGLQYIVIKEGTGKRPTENAEVEVNYNGTLIDGTVFDSSIDRNEPLKVFLKKTITGFIEGVKLMKKGSKYRLFIPQELAYGKAEHHNVIKPCSLLIFEVELLEIYEPKKID